MTTPSINFENSDNSNNSNPDFSTILPLKLLAWYDEFGRDLPWRTRGAHPNPYVVWISEIMLQQTTVKTVIPYFYRFMEQFPDVQSLAAADIDDVFLMWQGLGYYARARKMHECAQVLTKKYGGKFPKTREELLKLPGVGPYTAASISSLAFNKREAVIDGNVVRVISRVYGIRESTAESMPDTAESMPDIIEKAEYLMPKKRAADYTSAIMDLGATVCTPKNPSCSSCPFETYCIARHENTVDSIPLIEKIQKINKIGKLFWIENEEGCVFIRKRTEKGLLSGLTEFPWAAIEGDLENLNSILFPIEVDWENTGIHVKHIFTHINLTLYVYRTKVKGESQIALFNKFSGTGGGIGFVSKEEFQNYPFSTLMKKVISKAEEETAGKLKKKSGRSSKKPEANSKESERNSKEPETNSNKPETNSKKKIIKSLSEF